MHQFPPHGRLRIKKRHGKIAATCVPFLRGVAVGCWQNCARRRSSPFLTESDVLRDRAPRRGVRRLISPPALARRTVRRSSSPRRARASRRLSDRRLGVGLTLRRRRRRFFPRVRCDDNACRPSLTKAFAGFLTIGSYTC